MAYIYPDAEKLVGNERVDDGAGNFPGQCVSLVKKFTHAVPTSQWKEGARVKGNYALRIGTAIATFINGRYPSYATGNHAAFYCGQDASGIWVVDQSSQFQKIRKRKIFFKGNVGGIRRVNDGDAYSVIE